VTLPLPRAVHATPRRYLGRLILAIAALVLLLPARAQAHAHLESTAPAAGDTLRVAPRELLLTFSEGVELAESELRLLGPLGEVALAPLTASGGGAVLVAAVRGPLVAGRYTVQWRIMSDDGHPARGEYSFVIAAEARGLAPPAPAGPTAPGRAPPPAAHHAGAAPVGASFGVDSPLYAAVRWLTYVGLLLAIGAVAFRGLVLQTVARRERAAAAEFVDPAARRATSLGLLAAAILTIALVARLWAQSAAVHGMRQALDAERVGTMLTHTLWGWGWLLQAAGITVAVAGFLLARKGSPAGWWIALPGVVALGFSPALSGHAAATGRWTGLSIVADGLHVIGAGGWLGCLLVVIAAGVPVALRLGEGRRGRAVAALIESFSPAAMLFAGLVAATGVFASWLHLTGLSDLWTTPYGRTLLLKLALLLAVFGTGAYNWLRVKPSLGGESAARHLRRSATVELLVGLLVLAVTAVLVATPPPASFEAGGPSHEVAHHGATG
jgi:putative copper export protein/methionine-rich copper-binding protein CopC